NALSGEFSSISARTQQSLDGRLLVNVRVATPVRLFSLGTSLRLCEPCRLQVQGSRYKLMAVVGLRTRVAALARRRVFTTAAAMGNRLGANGGHRHTCAHLS